MRSYFAAFRTGRKKYELRYSRTHVGVDRDGLALAFQNNVAIREAVLDAHRGPRFSTPTCTRSSL